MNVYGLHKKADPSNCTVLAKKLSKNCLQNMKAETLRQAFFLKKIKFFGFHGVVLVKTFPLMYQLLM